LRMVTQNASGWAHWHSSSGELRVSRRVPNHWRRVVDARS